MTKEMRVFAFDFNGPAHLSAGTWRHPKDRGGEYKSLGYWVEYAKLLEAACFDGIFFADNDGYHETYKGSVNDSLKDAAQIPANDPSYLIPAMAAVTKNLSFGVTSSTAYDAPYKLARKFSTLDHLTDGRVGWNVVTSYTNSAARNIAGLEAAEAHDDRYARAEEFITVAMKLWETSWDEDAVLRDASTSTYVDPSRVHNIEHQGEHFSVPGIHLCEPSPQRTPVIFQAGGSPRGVALAAKTAEAVFLNAMTKEALKKQVDGLKAKALEFGRNPENIATLQMITVISAATDEEAQAKYEEYLKLVSYDGTMARYSSWAGVDLSAFDPDVPLKEIDTNAGQTMLNFFLKMDPSKDWTTRDIAEYIGIGGTSPVIVGGPETCADELISWMDQTGASGFNLANAIKFRDIKDFAEFVVPELQRRGAMRTSFAGSTLRETLFGEGNARLPLDHPGAALNQQTTAQAS